MSLRKDKQLHRREKKAKIKREEKHRKKTRSGKRGKGGVRKNKSLTMLPPGAAVDLTLGKAQFCLPYVCLKKRKEKKRKEKKRGGI